MSWGEKGREEERRSVVGGGLARKMGYLGVWLWIVGCGLGKWFWESFQRNADVYKCAAHFGPRHARVRGWTSWLYHLAYTRLIRQP